MMEIQRQEHGTKGAFFIEENGEWVAEMTYNKTVDGQLIIDHTEINDALKGKGIGRELVTAGVEFARKNNLKIVPICPFTKRIIDRTPEFHDILAD
jgi:uncharacterized protein